MRGLSRTRTVVLLLGVLAAASATVLLLLPESILRLPAIRGVVSALAGTDPRQFVLVLSGGVGLLALVLSLLRGAGQPTRDGFDGLRERPPEAVTESEAPRNGTVFDGQVETAVQRGGEPVGTVRGRLRSTAVRTYARTTGADEATARSAVASGDWTDDSTAAAFLAAPHGPTPSLGSRLRLWLDPVAERRRRIDSTVAAVESLLDDGYGQGKRRWSR